LNHPNIAIIHGLEQAGELHALVMELVAGEDLSQRIARGPIPIDEVLPIAKQIAQALEAAHEQGIIHRDLKPANIKVTSGGMVKVLDFGLAKLAAPDASGVGAGAGFSQSPTLTTPAATLAGVILGTAAYMAPEQARGKVVDRRADIWAFGCVVFETFTGQRTFEGDLISDVLASVLKTEPNWRALPVDTPTALQRLLRRCLEKDPRRRLQASGEARAQIDDLLSGAPDATVAPALSRALPRWRRVLPWAVVGTLAAGLAAMLVQWAPWRPAAPRGAAAARHAHDHHGIRPSGPDDQRQRSRPGPLTQRDARRLRRQRWDAALRTCARRARTDGDRQQQRAPRAVRLARRPVGRLCQQRQRHHAPEGRDLGWPADHARPPRRRLPRRDVGSRRYDHLRDQQHGDGAPARVRRRRDARGADPA
jgi:hypothetical protein